MWSGVRFLADATLSRKHTLPKVDEMYTTGWDAGITAHLLGVVLKMLRT